MRDSALGTWLGSMAFRLLVRRCLLASALASAAACTATSGDDGGAVGGGDGSGGGGSGGGGGGGGSGGSGGGGGGSVGGWTAMPLLDDTSHPDSVDHRGNDIVTGIYYESPDRGVIVTKGANATVQLGGAVFTATGSEVRSVAFRGNDPVPRLQGTVNFVGLERTPTGYIAMAYASDVIFSRDGGATFQAVANAGDGDFGTENVLAYRVTGTGTTLVTDTGVVSVSNDAPGPDTSYRRVWAPTAIPPVPAVIPPGQCHAAPAGANIPRTHDTVYVSPDRQRIAYTATDDLTQVPEICLSTDGGTTFVSHVLDVPDAALDFKPSGVIFTSATVGVTWFAQPHATSYIQRTTDAGETWSAVALPAEVAANDLELPAGSFAADGQHGWLAGFDHSSSRALVLATADGGVTWTAVGGVAGAVDAFHGGRLYSVFALDAAHVWLGGEGGLVIHN